MGSPWLVKFLINKTFSQRFFWSRLTRYPVVGRVVDHLLFKDDDIFYLPRDGAISIPIGENVDAEAGGTALPSAVLEHFIREAGFHWKMDFCICRDSTGCKDYPIDLGCLFLGEAARHINPKFGRPVSMEEALEHATRCREAGLVHLIGRNKLDSVWLNVGPPGKLLTVCNCCPCCCLWKVLPTIDPLIGDKVNRMPGILVEVTEECVGCGTCTKNVCFVNAIRLNERQAEIDPEVCRGCGRCVEACPKKAISMTIADNGFIAETIERISGAVEVK